ncbi:MAG TPA: SUMF1/EgtB/PvdO family nonheme iron enzyme [Polyangiales bacterium]|nr:SUMF1/EgtB/PvdO family nonheme iron enzyme [Polyangiales bacterium]
MRYLACALGLIALLSGCRQDAFCLNCNDGSGGTGGGGGGSGAAGDSGVAGDAAPSDEDGGGTSGVGGSAGSAGVPAACEPLGDEVCNKIDDDCDGNVDEDFDFTTNPRHCGGCDKACQGQNAETACEDSQCVMKGCLAGFADLDPDPGCEYQCPVSPGVAEDCNGIDDDCDGRVDEDLVKPSAAPYCNHVPGTPCEHVSLVCAKREGLTTWFCDYPSIVQFDPVVQDGIFPEETLCDGEDNDCDGQADEPWQADLGKDCNDGKTGACADFGKLRCAADKKSLECDYSLPPDPLPGAGPSAVELCNGLDDNCNGIVDDGVQDDMVHVMRPGFNFWIYKYEASRPDSTGGSAGISSARACSKSNAMPWNLVTYAAASAACTASGARLCTANEWEAACEGMSGLTYPYSNTYAADTCNGTEHDSVGSKPPIDNGPVATGAMNACVSPHGAFDLSGNLKEWTNDQQGTTGGGSPENIYVLRGGSYESPKLGLTCQTNLSRASAGTVLPGIGFRCCKDP